MSIKSNTRTELEGDLNVGRGQLGYNVTVDVLADSNLWDIYKGANSYILKPDANRVVTLPMIGLSNNEAQPGHKILIYNDSNFVLSINNSSNVLINNINSEKAAIYLAESGPDEWKLFYDSSLLTTTLQQAYEANNDNGITLNTVPNAYGEFDIIAPDLSTDSLRQFLSVYGSGGIGVGGLYFRSGNTPGTPNYAPYIAANGAEIIDPGPFSVAMGQGANAGLNHNFAFGFQAGTGGENAIAMGYQSQAISENSVTLGYISQVDISSEGAVAIGYNLSVRSPFAVGLGTIINVNPNCANSMVLGTGTLSNGSRRSLLLGYSDNIYTSPLDLTHTLVKVFPNGQYNLSNTTGYRTTDGLVSGVTSAPAIFKRSGSFNDLAAGTTSTPITILNSNVNTSYIPQGTSIVTVTVIGMSPANLGLDNIYSVTGKLRSLVTYTSNGVDTTNNYREMYKNLSSSPNLVVPVITNFNINLNIVPAGTNFSITLEITAPNDGSGNVPATMSFNYHVKVEHCYTY